VSVRRTEAAYLLSTFILNKIINRRAPLLLIDTPRYGFGKHRHSRVRALAMQKCNIQSQSANHPFLSALVWPVSPQRSYSPAQPAIKSPWQQSICPVTMTSNTPPRGQVQTGCRAFPSQTPSALILRGANMNIQGVCTKYTGSRMGPRNVQRALAACGERS